MSQSQAEASNICLIEISFRDPQCQRILSKNNPKMSNGVMVDSEISRILSFSRYLLSHILKVYPYILPTGAEAPPLNNFLLLFYSHYAYIVGQLLSDSVVWHIYKQKLLFIQDT